MNIVNSFIIKFSPILDIVKSRDVINTDEIGTSETTGAIPGVNRSFKMELSDGKSFIFKPKVGEHVSKWRHIPAKTQYAREKAAYLIDQQLDFNLVPETTIARHGNDIGSLQKWIENSYHVSGDYMKFIENLDGEQKLKAGIFDLIVGNTDRHGRNFLVSLEEV